MVVSAPLQRIEVVIDRRDVVHHDPLEQRSNVLVHRILVLDGLAPCSALLIVENTDARGVGQGVARTQPAVHHGEFRGESRLEVLPQHRVMTGIGIRLQLLIARIIVQIVAIGQLAVVADSEDRIVVVEDRIPLVAGTALLAP